MPYEITCLKKEDYQDAIDFIDLVFSLNRQPTDFQKLLPAYYQESKMDFKNHFIIKIDGKIRALVGVYPTKMVVNNTVLKVARIGAVSVHPAYRNLGFMKELMEYCNNLIQTNDYDFCMLGGRRHRYLFYGYERCGYKISYHITKSNIKHCPFTFDDIKVRKINQNDESIISYYKSLYDKEKIHFIRNDSDFYDICHHWENSLYGIFLKELPVGYFIIGNNNNITEIVCESEEISSKAIASFLNDSTIDIITVNCNPVNTKLCHEFGKIYESSEILPVQNIRIFNWEKVLTAFLSLKLENFSLPSGKLIVGINNYGNLKIIVENNKAVVEKTSEEAILYIDSTTASRFFFGNLQPSQVIDIHEFSFLLDSWFPLPFYISSQDFA